MHIQQRSLLTRVIVAAFCVIAMIPGISVAVAQSAETSYTDDEFGITVEWTDQWDVDVPTPDAPFLYLSRDSSISVLVFIDDGQVVSPEDAVWSLASEEDEILDDRSTETPAHLTMKLEETGLVYTVEAYSVNNGEATVIVAMGTIPVLQTSAVKIVSEDIKVNGSPVLTGQPIENAVADSDDATPETSTRTSRTSRDSTDTTDATSESTDRSDRISRNSRDVEETPEATVEADPTDEADTRVSRTSRDSSETPEPTDEADTRVSRSSRDSSETPEATEEATTEITRTSRTGSGGEEETPEATEIPTEEPTAEPTEDVTIQDDPGSYTGTVWGYSLSYDTELWERSSTYDNPTVDGFRLDGETATVAFVGMSDYGADPVGCLTGESEYFGTENDSISDWEIATDSNGDQLWFESDELAWGVFSYTFHSSSGTDVQFVDYISCETIPGEDAVLIVQMTSFPDDYNDNLDAVLDILDTLEFRP